MESGEYSDAVWHEITGYSYHVINDMLDGTINADNVTDFGNNGKSVFSLAFAGDIAFDPERPVMIHAEEKGGAIKCFDSKLVKYLKKCDFFMLNNEFCISDRGEPMTDKIYTFRSSPSNISILKDLGVDAVSLANNHVYV